MSDALNDRICTRAALSARVFCAAALVLLLGGCDLFDPSARSTLRFVVPENETAVLEAGTFDARHQAPPVLIERIVGGADAGHFVVDGTTGALAFSAAPDFESPADSNADNRYELQVVAPTYALAGESVRFEVRVADVSQLEAEVTYPTSGANLIGGPATTTIAGLLHDREDGVVLADDVARLSVAGVAATISEGDAPRWSAVVTTEQGENRVRIELASRNTVGVATRELVFENTISLLSPGRFALDAPGRRAFVYDLDLEALVEIDVDSGAARIVSSQNRGSGPMPRVSRASLLGASPVYDATHSRVLMTYGGVGIVEIDVETGDRTILWRMAFEDYGDTLFSPDSIAIRADGRHAIIVSDTRGLFELDLETGEIRTIKGNPNPDSFFNFYGNVIVDEANDRALIHPGSWGNPGVLAVDLSTGEETLLYQKFATPRVELPTSHGFGADLSSERAWFTSPSGIVLVDLDRDEPVDFTMGSQDFVSGTHPDGVVVGGGRPFLGEPYGLHYDPVSERLIATERGRGSLVAIDPDTGDRTDLAPSAVGSGPDYLRPRRGLAPSVLSLSASGDQILLGTDPPTALMIVSTEDGDRRVLSGADTSPVSIDHLDRVFTDPEFEVIVATERFSDDVRLIRVDPVTGERTLVVDDNAMPPTKVRIRDAVLNDASTRLLAIDSENEWLISIDVDSGEFVVLSGEGIGTGPAISNPTSLALVEAAGQAIVTLGDRAFTVEYEDTTGQLIEIPGREPDRLHIDLTTGDRVLIVADDTPDQEAEPDLRALGGPDPPGRRVYPELVFDHERSRVFLGAETLQVMDLVSGERAILSR